MNNAELLVEGKDYDIADPDPAAMIEALRAFGYDLPSAIADLVDNSIFAKARNIWIDFFWNGADSSICVTDDGEGMAEKKLWNAMRPGSQNPLETRDASDLGRYGLGLKTASFSQCRRLSVRSRIARTTSTTTRCWDLEFVARKKRWFLLREAPDSAEPHFDRLAKLDHGTAVLWEEMDRLVANNHVNDSLQKKHFHDRIASVEAHLGMVFHRFLNSKRLTLFVNKQKVDGWDPFLTSEKATQQLADERLSLLATQLRVVPYVLPHVSKLSPERHQKAGGIRGWNAHQGFYVYRNKRLLVAGDWLGLPFAKEEHFKLARILVDIPNSMDHQWEIDVTKSRAMPPDALRAEFKHIAAITRRRASEIYRHRGKVAARSSSRDFVFAWQQIQRRGKFLYRINREHPLIRRAMATSPELIGQLLRFIEETVPVPLLAITNSEHPDGHSAPFETASSKEISSLITEIYAVMLSTKVSSAEALERLAVMEPFDRYPELLEAFKETVKQS